MRLPLTAQLIAVGLLCLTFGTLLGTGCTALSRYSAEARADRAESSQKEAERQTAAAKSELETYRKELESSRTEVAQLNQQIAKLKADWSELKGNWFETSAEVKRLKRGDDSRYEAKTETKPNESAYSVISQDGHRLHVRLNEIVSEDDLRKLADVIQKEEARNESQLRIFFYLLGMSSKGTAWARADCDGTRCTVEIFGLTSDEERRLTSSADNNRDDVIGSWLDDTIGLPRRLTVTMRHGKVFVERRFKDNSGDEIEVTETKSPEGRRFDYKSDLGRELGGYYLITPQGQLEEWVRVQPGELLTSDVERKGDYGLYVRARPARKRNKQ